jgi:hypothetical protein
MIEEEPLTPAEARVRWAWAEARRIEAHWTAQLQDQQQRIATVLAANGILLGLLGSAVFAPQFLRSRPWPVYVLWAGFALVAGALVAGAAALWPRTKPAKGFWLDAGQVADEIETNTREHALSRLVADLVESQPPDKHPVRTIERRRFWLKLQLGLIMAGSMLLVAALFAVLLARH